MTTDLDRLRAVVEHAHAHRLVNTISNVSPWGEQVDLLVVAESIRPRRALPRFLAWCRSVGATTVTSSYRPVDEDEMDVLSAPGTLASACPIVVKAVLSGIERDLVRNHLHPDGTITVEWLARVVESAEDGA
jgi:hypothetical protein